jgi:hypothetical protein
MICGVQPELPIQRPRLARQPAARSASITVPTADVGVPASGPAGSRSRLGQIVAAGIRTLVDDAAEDAIGLRRDIDGNHALLMA